MDERSLEDNEPPALINPDEADAPAPAGGEVLDSTGDPASKTRAGIARVGRVREIDVFLGGSAQSPSVPLARSTPLARSLPVDQQASSAAKQSNTKSFSASARPPLRPSVAAVEAPGEREFGAALIRSKEIIAAARAEAEKIRQEALSTLHEERELARKRGLDEGRIEAAANLLNLSALRTSVIASAERELLEIAVSVAEEVVGETLKLQPESIYARLRRAMNYALNARRVTLSVNPADADYVRPRLEELLSGHGAQLSLALREDPTMSKGDARLETEISVVEASVAAHFAAIRAHLSSLTEEAQEPDR